MVIKIKYKIKIKLMMPKSKVDGWKCSKCGYGWCLKNENIPIVSCPKCQNKEVNTYG